MADPRMSQLLPTIRCGTCGNEVPYRDLGTHICEEAPAMPELPFQFSNKSDESKDSNNQNSPSSPPSRAPSLADNRNSDFDSSRSANSAFRSSTTKASSGFLEKYGRMGSQYPEDDDDRDAAKYTRGTARGREKSIPENVSSYRSAARSRTETREDQYSRRRGSHNSTPYSRTPPREGNDTLSYKSRGRESIDDTKSRNSQRSVPREKKNANLTQATYGGRERFISPSPDTYEDDDRSAVSRSSGNDRSPSTPFAETEDDEKNLSPPAQRRSTRSSNANSSAQDYIARKYGIAPLSSEEENEPLPPPDLNKGTEEDSTATSGSAPLNFLRNLFTSTSGNDQEEKRTGNVFEDPKKDLASKMKSLGVTPQKAVLTKPRGDAGALEERIKCGSCKRRIFASETALEAVGKTFHVSCFRCDHCDVPMGHKSNFLAVNGEVLCERQCGPAALDAALADRKPTPETENTRRAPERMEERKEQIVCHDCNKPITGRPVFALQKPFHEAHLRCKHCQSPILPGVGHVEHEGNIYCPEDFAQLFLPECHMCKKPIEREAVCALDNKWHPDCFGCQVCHDPFPDKSFYVFDNNPFCRRHYHEQNNSLCRSCDDPIEGACAQVQSDAQSKNQFDRYHPPCFSCTVCRRPLDDVYYNFNGRPYCERHIMEIQRKRNIRVERRRTVFSVLPPGR